GTHVVLLPVVSSRVPNHAIEDLDPELRPGPQGKGLGMRARVVNHADAPSERVTVRARLGDALIGGGDVTLQPDESRWASLPIDWRTGAGAGAEIKGKAPVVVESDVDALPGARHPGRAAPDGRIAPDPVPAHRAGKREDHVRPRGGGRHDHGRASGGGRGAAGRRVPGIPLR